MLRRYVETNRPVTDYKPQDIRDYLAKARADKDKEGRRRLTGQTLNEATVVAAKREFESHTGPFSKPLAAAIPAPKAAARTAKPSTCSIGCLRTRGAGDGMVLLPGRPITLSFPRQVQRSAVNIALAQGPGS
jgi:hypothetical protein